MSRTFSYIRVSTDKQDIEKDRFQVTQYVEKEKLPTPISFYEDDGVSTKINWKQRKLGKLISDMKENDILVTNEISRLARSMFEVMEIVNACQTKKCVVYIMNPSLKIDSSPTSQMISMIFGYAAQMERDLIRQRTKESLRVRRENGLKNGRPPGVANSKLDKHRSTIEAWIKEGKTKAEICRLFKTAPSNFYTWAKKRNIKFETKSNYKTSEWTNQIGLKITSSGIQETGKSDSDMKEKDRVA